MTLLKTKFLSTFTMFPFTILNTIYPWFFTISPLKWFYDVPVYTMSPFTMFPYTIATAPINNSDHNNAEI